MSSVRILAALGILCSTLLHAAPAEQKIVIKTLTAQMKYDLTGDIIAEPGQKLLITLENQDDLPHNLVICKPGTDTQAMCDKQMADAAAAVKRNWLPEDPAILAHTKMLNPHESETIEFTPQKIGRYPMVCTFPGHSIVMRGTLAVMNPGKGFEDLSFKLYLGNWQKLPDFDKLTPHREGAVPDKLLDFKLDDYKHEFGVRFEGTLIAPKAGNYRFYLTSDDGSRLSVDGTEITSHDGIHPAGSIQQGNAKLTAGPHKVRIDFFQAHGGCELYAAWKGANFPITPLSRYMPDGWKDGKKKRKDAETTGMPLVPKERPIMYRNFIAGAGNRGIGVGYPGGVNLAWSAESMNLVQYWRGGFIDAARHWNSRGGGHQPPSGYDIVTTASELSPLLAVLEKPDAEWPKWTPETQGLKWCGYELDSAGLPTFRYSWQNLKVTDSFRAEGDGTLPNPGTKLHRSIGLEGNTPQGTWLCLATAEKITQSQPGSFLLQRNKRSFTVQAKGAQIAGRNLLLPATAGVVTVTYAWN
jgi:azurin